MHFTTFVVSVLAAAASSFAAPLPTQPDARFVVTHDMVIKPHRIVPHKDNFEIHGPHM